MSNSLKGWTPRQSAARCATPANLAAHVDANHEWAKTGYQKSFVLSASFWNTEEAAQAVRDRASKRLYDQSKRTLRAVWDDLRQHLMAETLLARGRRGSPTAEKKLIPPSAWRHLIFKSGGTAEEPDKTRIYDIEIYPTLLAPDMPIAVDGKSLSEVLRRFVRDDPQVKARQAKAIEACAQVQTFGVPVGPRTVWKFNHGRDYNEIIGFLNEPRLRVALIADMTLGKRYSALVAHLFEGRLVAEGLPKGMAPISSVPRSLWAHKDTYVDLRNGDLLRINDDTDEPSDLLVSLYAAIVVRAPSGTAERAPALSAEAIAASSSRMVVASGKAEKECQAWLASEMRKSLEVRPKPKAAWREEAQKKWGDKLSGHSFERAWRAAADETGAGAWLASGRPRKSK